MPNGQADYLGIDEGAMVASADLRTHAASGNVAGSGFGVNNFAAIYTKNFPAGAIPASSRRLRMAVSTSMVLPYAPAPEPTTLVPAVLGICGGAMLAYRRRSM